MGISIGGGSFLPRWQHPTGPRQGDSASTGPGHGKAAQQSGEPTFMDGERTGGVEDLRVGEVYSPSPRISIEGTSASAATGQQDSRGHRQHSQELVESTFGDAARKAAQSAPGLNVVIRDPNGKIEFASGPEAGSMSAEPRGLLGRLGGWLRGLIS